MTAPGEGLKLPKLYRGVYWEDGLQLDEVRLLHMRARIEIRGKRLEDRDSMLETRG